VQRHDGLENQVLETVPSAVMDHPVMMPLRVIELRRWLLSVALMSRVQAPIMGLGLR
jgi:hypothetical protein